MTDWTQHLDDISDAISDSMDMDWAANDGARAVVRWLNGHNPLTAAPVREEGGAVDADTILEMAAKAVEDHQKIGREWIKGSLWDDLTREASARIRALKADVRAQPPALTTAFMTRAKHLLDLAEKAEDDALEGDEGCVWPVEALRVAYTDLSALATREEAPAAAGEDTELIAALRSMPRCHCAGDDWPSLYDRAADRLEALRTRPQARSGEVQ